VLGGSGIGEAIAANKVAGIRAAVVTSDDTARLTRMHNDSNVLALGGRTNAHADAVRWLGIWLDTAFEGGRTSRACADRRIRVRPFREVTMSELRERDPAIFDAIQGERGRQLGTLELIASENFASEAVLEALGSVMNNKYAEGCRASATTAAASSSTARRSWRSSASASCSARSTPTCRRIPARRPTSPRT
jgi:hypothetical protein